MQVEAAAPAAPTATYQRANYSASPQLTAASPPTTGASLNAYSFPPPPRTAAGDEHLQRTRTVGTASPAPSASEFVPSRHGEGNFSFTAPPHSHQHQHGHEHGHEQGSPHAHDQPRPEAYSQPRSMSLAGLVEFDGAPLARTSSPAMAQGVHAHAPHQHSQQQQQQHEYSSLGRSVLAGGQVHRVLSSFQFAEYLPEHPHMAPPAHLAQQQIHHHHPGGSSQFAPPAPGPAHPFVQYRPYTFGTASAPSHPLARASYAAGPPGPPLEWAKPRANGDESPAGQHARAFAPPPGSSRGPQHHQQQQPAHMVYYSPHHPGGMMIRSESNQSGLSSFSESTESSHPSNGGNASDYEGHHINPAFVNAGGDSGYYSSPQMDRSGELARSTSSNDLGGVSGLRLDGSPALGSSSSSAMPRPTKTDSDKTIRGLKLNNASKTTLRAVTGYDDDDDEASTPSSGGKARRRIASTIFHPSPQSMLALGAYSPSGSAIGARRGKPYATMQHTAILPTDNEFAALPTKRSRGRRPPVKTDLGADEVDPNGEPTEAQIAWVGTTKTGKIKKIFLCKVPGCGKCFKRSEHLKRHVRSIHTNEKPFQCQWPTCKRLFSRHDNLNQHLRIHREPGMTDAEFSAALQDCFGQRLEEVQRERSWAAPAAPAPGSGAGDAGRSREQSFEVGFGPAGDGAQSADGDAEGDMNADADAEGEGEYVTEDDSERAFAAPAQAAPARRSRARVVDDDDEYDPNAERQQLLYGARGTGRRTRTE
ncbi:hypothetical protein JCM10450v2_002465 [Rhodotorula kratochvilovae]